MRIEGEIASVTYMLEVFLFSRFFGLRGLSVSVEKELFREEGKL